LGSILVKLGFIDEQKIAEFLSQQYGVPYVDLKEAKIDKKVLSLIPREICKKYMVVPFDKVGNLLYVAIADPSNVYALEDLRFVTGLYHQTICYGRICYPKKYWKQILRVKH